MLPFNGSVGFVSPQATISRIMSDFSCGRACSIRNHSLFAFLPGDHPGSIVYCLFPWVTLVQSPKIYCFPYHTWCMEIRYIRGRKFWRVTFLRFGENSGTTIATPRDSTERFLIIWVTTTTMQQDKIWRGLLGATVVWGRGIPWSPQWRDAILFLSND